MCTLSCVAVGALEDAALQCPLRNRCLQGLLCCVRELKIFLYCHCAFFLFICFGFVLVFFGEIVSSLILLLGHLAPEFVFFLSLEGRAVLVVPARQKKVK